MHTSAEQLAIIASAVFFLTGLLTGVWKYREMVTSGNGQAHPYIDIAHRSALLYSFAALLTLEFVRLSQLSDTLELIAVVMLLGFFALAIASYIVQGILKRTDNQLQPHTASVRGFMWALIGAEIGGFSILFYGVMRAI